MDEQKKKTVAKYPKLCVTVESILLVFSSLYIVKSGFSHVQLFIKQTEKYFEHRMWFVAQTHKPAT